MATADLQNSYGPELDASHNLPQAITSHDGLEAVPPQQPIAPPYHEQAEKNDTYHDHNNGTAYPPPRSGRKRILGLPVVAFWGVIVGLVVILAVALGAGLGVGLSQRSDSASATSASASASASPVSDTATTTTDAPSSSSSGASTTTSSSTTTTSEAPQATARNVEICQNASLDTCKNLTVPVNTCIEFPSAYNDSVSSLNTGGPECYFYTGENCSGDSWTTNGSQLLIPGKYNDKFSSVACYFK